jgi:hypothetical protein
LSRNLAFSAVDKKDVIKAAVKFWEDNACLQFQLGGSGINSIGFFNGSGCYSRIGMVGGDQPLSIGEGCEYVSDFLISVNIVSNL